MPNEFERPLGNLPTPLIPQSNQCIYVRPGKHLKRSIEIYSEKLSSKQILHCKDKNCAVISNILFDMAAEIISSKEAFAPYVGNSRMERIKSLDEPRHVCL